MREGEGKEEREGREGRGEDKRGDLVTYLAMRLWIVTLATRPSGGYEDVTVDELVRNSSHTTVSFSFLFSSPFHKKEMSSGM